MLNKCKWMALGAASLTVLITLILILDQSIVQASIVKDRSSTYLTWQLRPQVERSQTLEPPPTPASGATCSGLSVEAEDGLLAGTFTIADDELASGGSYIHIPNSPETLAATSTESMDRVSPVDQSTSDNYAEFCFIISQPGLYRIKANVYAADTLDNSFEVGIGDAPTATYDWIIPINNPNDSTYQLDYVTEQDRITPLEFELPVGEQIIRFYEREDGARLDRIMLEYIGDNQPPTISHPGDQRHSEGDFAVVFINAADDDSDPLTYSASGLPAGLAIDSEVGTISGALESGSAGTYNIIVYVDDGTNGALVKFRWLVDSGTSAECGDMSQEAESGNLFGKMAIGVDEGASGGAYISFPYIDPADLEEEDANRVQAQSLSRKHRADYCVTVPNTGEYRLRTQIYAPTAVANSFFVQINSAPLAGIKWDIYPIEATFNTDYVSQRGGDDPYVFKLSQGTHIVSFLLRENDARLDSFTLEPISIEPTQTVTPTQEDLEENLAQEELARITHRVFTPFILYQ